MTTIISTPAQAIERAAQIADDWAGENKASAAKARRSVSEGCQNMAEMLDGAAIECNAIAAEIRKLADHIDRMNSNDAAQAMIGCVVHDKQHGRIFIDESKAQELLLSYVSSLRTALSEAIEVLESINDDEINLEFLPGLRDALGDGLVA